MLLSANKGLTPYRLYTEEEYNKAKENILLHKQSTVKFNSVLEGANGVTLYGDYTLARVSHNYFSNCIFDSASLDSVAGTGSIFTNVKFLNTNINNAGFSNGTIDNCYFENCTLNNSNFSNSYIRNTIWKDCNLSGLNISASHLKNCKFCGETTKPGNLNETHFESVEINDVRFTNLNLEYSMFENIKTHNTILPFSQIPYVFGGIDYLLNTKDNVRISSHINKTDSISISEYIAVLNDMEVFYSYKNELFPLANILLSLGRKEEALYAALCGIVFSIKESDYRMCKNFAKLLTYKQFFSPEQLVSLYKEIESRIIIKELSDADFFQYNKYIYDIKSLLNSNPNNKTITLFLKTNIENTDSKEASLLIEMIDHFTHLDGVNLSQPKLTISHNSPLLLAVTISGISLAKIIAITGLILTAVAGVCKSLNEIADFIIKIQKIIKNRKDRKDKDNEHRDKRDKEIKQASTIESEIYNIENANPNIYKEINIYSQTINSSNILIDNAIVDCENFNIYNDIK